jgi:hypothetical protein
MPKSKPADQLAAQKAQQEENRAAYLKRRFTPAELWQQQQKTLAALARLRPGVKNKVRKPAGDCS